MEIFIDALQIIVPALVVFATAYYLVKNFLDSEREKCASEIKMGNQNLVTPLRLQAFERVVLFLERISPNSLVMRVHTSGMSARLLHAELVKTIRLEFEHNVSQQIYMSNKSWTEIKNAKEETIKLINISASSLDSMATGTQLCEKIIEFAGQIAKLPTQIAIEHLKKEITQSF